MPRSPSSDDVDRKSRSRSKKRKRDRRRRSESSDSSSSSSASSSSSDRSSSKRTPKRKIDKSKPRKRSSSSKKERKRKRSTSSSSSSSCSSYASKKKMKEKKKKKKQKKEKRKKKKKDKSKVKKDIARGPVLGVATPITGEVKSTKPLLPELPQKSTISGATVGPAPRVLKPMTKEEWEKQQSIMRHVYDEETGRTRLIRGDGEVIEDIVSKERHRDINKASTQADGRFFSSRMGLL